MNTDRHVPLRMFLFAFAVLTALDSNPAQTANSIASSTSLGSAAKRDDAIAASRAVAALEGLKAAVLVYRSNGEFETDGRLARVPLETFVDKLNRVTVEVESILSRLSDAKLRSHLSNALYSYRDGAFWWAKLAPQKVVTIENLRVGFRTTTPAERFFQSNVPYTVVFHWRQANKYLLRAQRLIFEANPTVSEHGRLLLQDCKFEG